MYWEVIFWGRNRYIFELKNKKHIYFSLYYAICNLTQWNYNKGKMYKIVSVLN
jgi:hypothetical protein